LNQIDKVVMEYRICLYPEGAPGSFSQSTGLRVNYKKSCLVPLNLLPEKAQQLAGVFGCKLETLPFTYLGLPMGTTKPRVDNFGFIMNEVERKITATSNFLTHAGRLQLVNSVYPLCQHMQCAPSNSQCLYLNTLTEREDIVCGEALTVMRR